MKKSIGSRIGMGIVCFVLTLAITIQIKTMKMENSIVSQSFADDELKDSLLSWKEKYDKEVERLADSEKDLENMRKTSTTNISNSAEKTEKLKQNNLLLGLTKVKGDGIVITLKDAQSGSQIEDASNLIIHDGDLREIVNELANAGAEAIEINGERIVNSTYILCAGNVILVNGEKVSSPCTIKAIGQQEKLYGALERAGGTIQQMRMNKMPIEIKKTSNIEIAKYNGALTKKYMKTRGE